MRLFFLTALICTINICSYSQEQYTYSSPQKLADGWDTGHFKSVGIDSSIYYKFFDQLIKADHKIHSMLLIKDDVMVMEEYFNGNNANTQHDLRSVTKSIFSLLLGIAIDKGFIESIDDPISTYLKSHQVNKNIDPQKRLITIKHLITMSSGLDCNDWDKSSKGNEDKVYKKKDWLQYTLDLPLIHKPGKVSAYCSAGTILTAEIISQASGLSIDEFAQKYLFNLLDIKDYHWGHTSEKKVIDSGKRLYMRSRDLAKIGKLVLQKGLWEEKQIISSRWIEESTNKHTKITNIDYGYLWWNFTFNADGKSSKMIGATGNGGQYIMVFPEVNMIAIFTGGAYNLPDDKIPFNIVNKVYLPSIEP